jgi:hypothetical protein
MWLLLIAISKKKTEVFYKKDKSLRKLGRGQNFCHYVEKDESIEQKFSLFITLLPVLRCLAVVVVKKRNGNDLEI